MTDEQLTNEQLLDGWYHYVARSEGFIGAALCAQREKAFLVQEQQRAMLGILDKKYDQIWLRLQAMHLPRSDRYSDQFAMDLARIVAKVVGDVGIEAAVDVERLGELLRAGLE
jgi:hypothetical protein